MIGGMNYIHKAWGLQDSTVEGVNTDESAICQHVCSPRGGAVDDFGFGFAMVTLAILLWRRWLDRRPATPGEADRQ